LDKKSLITIIRWLAIIGLPFLLAVFTVRSLIGWRSPGYPAFEYGRIAPDVYGFSDQERLDLANATLDYLQRPEPAEEVIYLLEDLRLPGTDQPLYNPEEIGHMLDVKIIADAFKRVMWGLAVVVIGGLAFLLARSETRQLGYKTLMQGGLLTTAILLVVGILIGVAWNFVFVQFHELLFPPGTWTFAYTDSLIRLFPEQFWFDFGVIWVGGILIQGVILAAIGYWLNRKAS
jgi:integral membrane protein (TIGR01906 family)